MTKRMTKAEKRVAVAKDALKQLKHYNITQGTYGNFHRMLPKNKSLKNILPQVRKGCHICAIGALFLSHIGLFNKFNTNKLKGGSRLDNDTCVEQLRDCFNEYQLNLIESAFEGWTYEYCEKGELLSIDLGYASEFIDIEERLKVILKNIIRNKGEFIPAKATDKNPRW